MEDSFRVRVDKVFGSLSSSLSSTTTSSSLSSLWCLTDEEIERRKWNRERESPEDEDLESKPYPSNLDGFVANPAMSSQNKLSDFRRALQSDLKDENDEGPRRCPSSSAQSAKPDDNDDEVREIRSSIGLDCTLDYEEEEDEYDKVAIGKEKAGDRLYMKDITDYGAGINSYNELPNTFGDVTRDPRANHIAAKIRLKEDAEAAGKFVSLRVSDNTEPPAVETQNNTMEDGVDLKPILKRRENPMDSKSQKRVRFDPDCKYASEGDSEGTQDLVMDTCTLPQDNSGLLDYIKNPSALEGASVLPQDSSGVPDYIRNPSKYTRYTFDSSNDVDEESNRNAYMDFLNHLRQPNTTASQADDTKIDLPKSVVWTPKKKPGDTMTVKIGNEFKQNTEDVCKQFVHKKGLPISIPAAAAQESEVSAMDEDEPEIAANKSSSLQRQGRQYRTKASVDLDELVT